jgi:hypothetical protein
LVNVASAFALESGDTNFTVMVGSEPTYLSFFGPGLFHVVYQYPVGVDLVPEASLAVDAGEDGAGGGEGETPNFVSIRDEVGEGV